MRREKGLTIGHLKLLLCICAGGMFCGFLSFLVENLLAWRKTKHLKLLKILKRKERKDRKEKRKKSPPRKDSRATIASTTSVSSILTDHSCSPSITVTDTEKED
ncbi:unnamed protein product [Allacma fusca]|uniref:Uncharacterized protein n=1 Tax=Allacma fusca TaxID=39272 RepID=A0A8J2KQ09_9HEXA|nr:unnamed protein product [Allacma fusca]